MLPHACRRISAPMPLQLSGYNLVPFTFDKQVLLLSTIYSIFQCAPPHAPAVAVFSALHWTLLPADLRRADGLPIGNVNVSDWRAAEAVKNGSR